MGGANTIDRGRLHRGPLGTLSYVGEVSLLDRLPLDVRQPFGGSRCPTLEGVDAILLMKIASLGLLLLLLGLRRPISSRGRVRRLLTLQICRELVWPLAIS